MIKNIFGLFMRLYYLQKFRVLSLRSRRLFTIGEPSDSGVVSPNELSFENIPESNLEWNFDALGKFFAILRLENYISRLKVSI